MKRRLCGYCGQSFKPKRKGIWACSKVCRATRIKASNCIRNHRRSTSTLAGRTPRGGSSAGCNDVSPVIASGSVTIEEYRNLMRIET